ncbi:7 transmembrane sweet-taste receptor of 3 GCPR domain-containing protein [Ditylenchus destructor]|uniref:Gamma-aminobutyric acid type B receptor subunit 2 n=1 Tax=Ditylenchus destructor TaxID=166010 RepID=A0AAD4N4T2_9BILA|nr:7 transmembrane sweet-taste receptor of 3 GCPR domain-containing protein [Ditylenchus destructor]
MVLRRCMRFEVRRCKEFIAEEHPAVTGPLKHIHATSDLLPDYCLQLIYKDTQCKTSLGMKSLFDLMNTGNNFSNGIEWSSNDAWEKQIVSRPAALFGDVCTDVNEPVAMASKYWDILHLSYAETHAKFSTADSRDVYPTFFRIVPGDRNLITARVQLIKNFNWTRVGTIKQSDEAFYSLPHERLTTVLENDYNVRVVYTAGLSSEQLANIGDELEELKQRDVHIIVGDFSPLLALHILCSAHMKQMFGPNYLWILPGYHRSDWWLEPERRTNCTQQQIDQVLEGHFALEFAPMRGFTNERLVADRSLSSVQRELLESCRNEGQLCEDMDVHSAYAYDGMWTLALALNQSIYSKNTISAQSPISASRLLPIIQNSSFQGLTGKVRFENNERLGLVHILQWSNGSYTKVGYFDNAENSFRLRRTVPGWSPPLDATVVVRQRQYISYYLLVIMSSLSLIGICLALLFFFVNVKYRNHRFIKMSSPNMNNLIIAGSVCSYAAVILLGIDTRFVSPAIFEKLCYAKTWVLSIGFTLAFGSMFSKTWRVHSIFTNIRRDKKAIKDFKLYIIVATIMLIDAIILFLWAIISPFQFSVTEHETIRSHNSLIVPELERCKSDYSVVFQVVFYIFKGMLMLFGCFLAWETRAVNIPALNDSKYIGMSVYIVVVMCVVGLALAFILQDRLNEAFALISFFIIFCTTLTLSLVFMPKLIEVIRTPHGTDQQRYRKGMMKSMVGKQGHASSRADKLNRQLSLRASEGIKEKICHIEEENLRLHEILITKSAELWDLLERLRVLGESVKNQKGKGGLYCVGAQLTGNVIVESSSSEEVLKADGDISKKMPSRLNNCFNECAKLEIGNNEQVGLSTTSTRENPQAQYSNNLNNNDDSAVCFSMSQSSPLLSSAHSQSSIDFKMGKSKTTYAFELYSDEPNTLQNPSTVRIHSTREHKIESFCEYPAELSSESQEDIL